MLWLVLSLMTAAAVLCVAWPLLRPRREAAVGTDDVRFYRDQIRELDADVERGLLRPTDVESTRAELGRRLLTSADRPRSPVSPVRRRRLAAALAGVGIVVVAGGLYGLVGRPGLPDEPLAARENGPDGFALALARMEAHLASDPNDGRGFEMMAPVYMKMGRYDDAAHAYAAEIRLLGATAPRLGELGQARVMAADGVVTDEARKAFDDALKADPTQAQSRFFEGLAALQDGDKPKARTIWTAMVDEAPPGAPYVGPIRDRIAELDGTPSAPAVSSHPPASAPMAGMPAGATAIAALPAAQQQVAIRGMVDGLAARLAQNGNDADGWLRLVRAYRVLGEPDLAKKALAEARKSVGTDPKVAGRLDELAHELGLEG